MSEPLWQPRTDRAARLLGAGFFLGGAALIGYQIHVLLADVGAHADRLTFFLTAIALGEMGVVFGAYWLIRGLAGYAAIRALQADRRRMRIFTSVAAIVIIASTVGIKFWLASLGYDQ